MTSRRRPFGIPSCFAVGNPARAAAVCRELDQAGSGTWSYPNNPVGVYFVAREFKG